MIAVGVLVLVVAPTIFFVVQMRRFGLGWSHLTTAPTEVSEAVTYDAQKETAMSTAKPTKTDNPSGGLPISQKQTTALDKYTAAMAFTDGMSEWIQGIESGYADGQVAITVTTNFQVQSEPVRAEIADIFLVAWERVYQAEGRERATITLLNSQGQKVGGSKALTREIFFE